MPRTPKMQAATEVPATRRLVDTASTDTALALLVDHAAREEKVA